MNCTVRRHLTLAAFCLAASPALADEPVQPATGEQAVARRLAEAGNEQAGRVMSAGSPNSRAAAGFSASNVQFSQEGDETSVSVAFSLNLTSYREPQRAEDFYRVSQTRLSVVASAPIDKGTKDGALFAGDSLVSGSKLKLSVSTFSTRVGTGAGAGPAISAAYRTCVGQNARQWAAGQPDRPKAAAEAAGLIAELEAKLAWRGSAMNIDGVMSGLDDQGALGKVVRQACYPGQADSELNDEYALVAKYGSDPVTFGRRFLPDGSRLTFWGFDASMGQDDHSFLDRTAFKLETDQRTTWEVGGYAGFINSDLTFSLRGRLVYGQTYKANDEAEICRTVSIPAGPECLKGPDGAPLRQRTGLASLEARKLVHVSDGTDIAIAPQVTYRFKDRNLGVEVPIYLSPDKDGKLSGGIKAVYNSKGDEFALGLFVGVPFSIFYD